MSRAYPHTVTVWRRDGEDGERRAVWARRVLRGVRWIEARAKSSDMEDSARDEARPVSYTHLTLPTILLV